jgi:hypothetical protein
LISQPFCFNLLALSSGVSLTDFGGDTPNHLANLNPDHMRGRVSAVNLMFVGSSNELGL